MAIFLGEELSEEKLKSMEIHQMEFMDKGTKVVMRVPGGFLYTIYKSYGNREKPDDTNRQHVVNTVFVPYPEEWK